MGYLNPIMQFGFENFCRNVVSTASLSPTSFRDYQEHYRIIAERYNIRVIMLITPKPAKNGYAR